MIRSALAQFQNKRKKAISIRFHALNIAKTTYLIINKSTKGHYIGRPGVIGLAEFYKTGQMRTKRRGYAFLFVEIFQTSLQIQSIFCPYFSEPIGIFLRNLAALIQVSIGPF